jgi:release factor glutamine methyltransferase
MAMADKNWTVGDVLTWTTSRFQQCDLPTPLLDAQLLLCFVLKTQKINLYIDYQKPLTSDERRVYRDLVARRLNGEPVAYILSEKDWYHLNLYVDPNVLIPRPETECIVDFVKDAFQFANTEPKVIFDFCTGSGCLALALAQAYPKATVVGVDISSPALKIAAKNAARNHVQNCQWRLLDLSQSSSFESLKNDFGQPQAIVANPPYVTEKEWVSLDISVKNYEPKLALTSPDDGLFLAKEIIKNTIDIEFFAQNDRHFFSMELSQGQPSQLQAVQEFHSVSTAFTQGQFDEWFSLCDFDGKQRFLCRY